MHNLDLEEVVFEIKFIAEYSLSLYCALISIQALPEFFGVSKKVCVGKAVRLL